MEHLFHIHIKLKFPNFFKDFSWNIFYLNILLFKQHSIFKSVGHYWNNVTLKQYVFPAFKKTHVNKYSFSLYLSCWLKVIIFRKSIHYWIFNFVLSFHITYEQKNCFSCIFNLRYCWYSKTYFRNAGFLSQNHYSILMYWLV